MSADQSLLYQELLLRTPSLDGLADGIFEDDREIELIGVTDADGLEVLPAFSTEQALLRWAPDGSPYVALDGRTVLGLFLRGSWDKIVVDGNSDDAFEVTLDQAEALLHAGSK